MSFGIAEALIGNKRIYSINKIICLNEKKTIFYYLFQILGGKFRSLHHQAIFTRNFKYRLHVVQGSYGVSYDIEFIYALHVTDF